MYIRYFLIFLLALSGCKFVEDVSPCADSDISICFEGFDSTDLSNIEMSVYQRGTAFQNAEQIINTGFNVEDMQKRDNSCQNFPPFLHINVDKDYKINFRNTPGQVYSLSELQYYRVDKNQEQAACYNNLSRYKLDTLKKSTDHFSGSIIRRDYQIVIKKK